MSDELLNNQVQNMFATKRLIFKLPVIPVMSVGDEIYCLFKPAIISDLMKSVEERATEPPQSKRNAGFCFSQSDSALQSFTSYPTNSLMIKLI